MTNRIVTLVSVRSSGSTPKASRLKGYTLIEVMIVVAIVGILSAVAYPSYTNYIKRAHRTDAMETLNQIMAQQQRYVLRKRTFTTDFTDLGYAAGEIVGGTDLRTEDGYYTVRPTPCGTGIARCVQLTARPVPGTTQATDGDADNGANRGILTLNSRGDKSWDGKVGWFHRDS